MQMPGDFAASSSLLTKGTLPARLHLIIAEIAATAIVLTPKPKAASPNRQAPSSGCRGCNTPPHFG